MFDLSRCKLDTDSFLKYLKCFAIKLGFDANLSYRKHCSLCTNFHERFTFVNKQ